MDTILSVVGFIAFFFILAAIFVFFWAVGVYNDLARKRARTLAELGSIEAYNSRADRVNPAVKRAAIFGCGHELRAIQSQSSRGRGGSSSGRHNRFKKQNPRLKG